MTSDLGLVLNFFGLGLVTRSNHIYPNHVMAGITLQIKLREMMVGLISIYKCDLYSVKKEIYYQIMRVITKNACNHRLILLIKTDFFI